jgi:hypothetical protein
LGIDISPNVLSLSTLDNNTTTFSFVSPRYRCCFAIFVSLNNKFCFYIPNNHSLSRISTQIIIRFHFLLLTSGVTAAAGKYSHCNSYLTRAGSVSVQTTPINKSHAGLNNMGTPHGSNNSLAWWRGKQHAHAGSHHIQLVPVLLRPALRSAYHHSNQVI